ncbi:TPA: DUF2726 domain-containing protein [Vibrio parahaemolyticus]|nr:DUF2726 domain-containing protein [Vibrio parahaemolyticus]
MDAPASVKNNKYRPHEGGIFMEKILNISNLQVGLGIIALATMGLMFMNPILCLILALLGMAVMFAWEQIKKLLKLSVSRDDRLKDADGNLVDYSLKSGLLTKAERSFYGVLQTVVPDELVVMSKVRIADVLYATKGLDRKDSARLFAKISSKHFDFVLCLRTDLSYVAAIELDDSSHQKKSRKDRDEFVELACKSAGLPLYRCRAQYAYQPDELRNYLFETSTQQNWDVSSEKV